MFTLQSLLGASAPIAVRALIGTNTGAPKALRGACKTLVWVLLYLVRRLQATITDPFFPANEYGTVEIEEMAPPSDGDPTSP